MMVLRKLGVLMLFLLVMWHPSAARAEKNAAKTEDSCHKGAFSSDTYLYSIALPEGLLCCHDPAPNPVHGCAVSLPGAHSFRLWVDGSYNALDFNSAEDALFSSVGSDFVAGTTLTVLRREPAKLGSFEAVRLTLRIKRQGKAETQIEDLVMAIGPRGGDPDNVVYTVGFLGPEAEYPKYEKIFAQIVSSWRAGELKRP